MLSATRLLAVSRKEVIQLRRDARSLIMAFAIPVVLLVFFSYAITFDVREIRMALLDQDGTARSRELAEAFQASTFFTIARRLQRYAEAERLLDRGEVRLVLVIPRGFAERLDAGREAPVQALVDGADANTATIALSYARGIAAEFSARALVRGRRLAPPARAETRIWYNESLKSSNMIVPGLIAVIMMILAAMLTSLTIAREWERGTMEQLASTPVHRVEVVLGKLLPYLGIGLLDVIVTAAVGVAIFDVPFRGSPVFLAGTALFFLLGALGLGIFISAGARSQLLATQVSMLATYLPALLLSGFMFDIANMPRILQAISLVVPARYFIVATRGIFLKGVGPPVLWVQGVAMIVFGAVGLALAVRAFRKEIL